MPPRAAEAGLAARDEASPVRSLAAQVGLGVAMILVFAALVALGTWQLYRLSWKLDLIARVDGRVHAAPVAPPGRAGWSDFNAEAQEYRHVRVTGAFLHNREALVQAVTDLGPGFWVLTPLRMADGTFVLINRGFVPPERRDPATRSAGQIAGETTVTGLLRVTEPRGGFLRSNDPAANRWYSRDVAAIAAARGLTDTAPYFIDADAAPNPGGWPVGGLTVVTFRNAHLAYAITWYALAAMLAGVSIWLFRNPRRSRIGHTPKPASP